MSALRSLAALLVVLVLLGGVALGAEWFARGQVEAVVAEQVERQLRQASDDGAGFGDVTADVEGLALVALVTGRFEGIRVTASDGVVEGVPVEGLLLDATGVSTNGRSVRGLDATLRLDAATAVASQLDPALAEAVTGSAVAVPPDRVRVSAPYELPLLGEVPVEVEVLVRVGDGGLVVEPVSAVAAGLDVDLTGTDLLPSYGIAADQLPVGLRVDTVEVVDDAGRPVVVAQLSCATGCSFG
ncbi:hypothetical protein [Aquipuribacter sp. MA13-6]|uniref:hypothetical protein n=1 Tax=unclassified Aquipuribacter TaxID=2635084 RepID=UPI003EE97AC7